MAELNEDAVAVEAGFLRESLNRNSAQIKKDRAEIIHEDLQMVFSRSVEDTAKDLKRAKREITNMYDFSPTNSPIPHPHVLPSMHAP